MYLCPKIPRLHFLLPRDRRKSCIRAPAERDIMSRFVQNPEAKRAIGRICCDLIEDGEAIFLDCGTTTHHVAQQLATRGLHLTIKRPQRVIVPMDRSKIGIADFAKVCEPREIDVLVTDCANDDLRRHLRSS
jgi:DeoR/GlpR family transcriptional regulator of sugar metabolism